MPVNLLEDHNLLSSFLDAHFTFVLNLGRNEFTGFSCLTEILHSNAMTAYISCFICIAQLTQSWIKGLERALPLNLGLTGCTPGPC